MKEGNEIMIQSIKIDTCNTSVFLLESHKRLSLNYRCYTYIML